MIFRLSLFAVLMLVSCGPAPKKATVPPRTQSVQGHLAESDRHNADATAHAKQASGVRGEAATDIKCADDPLESVSYIGTEPYKIIRPCWDAPKTSGDWHRNEEIRHLREASEHRAMADALVAAEGRACAGLGAVEVSWSPLTRGNSITQVEPLYEGGELQGATITLRKTPGLSAAWLKRSLSCHRARAASLGYPSRFMTECPMSLPGVSAEVFDSEGVLTVKVRATRDEIAAAILGRAELTVRAARDQPQQP